MKWSHRNGWRNVQTTRKKRSMLKKQGHHHLQHHQYNYYSGSVLLCEIYHQTFYDPFIFCVSLRCYNPASSDGSLVKSWSVSQPEDPFEKCLSKNFELLLLLARKRGSPFAWWCLLMAAAPDPGLRSGHLLNVVGVSIWDLLLGLAPVTRLVTATLPLLCISAPRSKSSCWYRGCSTVVVPFAKQRYFLIPQWFTSI